MDSADDMFDFVVDTFGLCSFNDPVNVLREMARVAKPDGKILLLEHGKRLARLRCILHFIALTQLKATTTG